MPLSTYHPIDIDNLCVFEIVEVKKILFIRFRYIYMVHVDADPRTRGDFERAKSTSRGLIKWPAWALGIGATVTTLGMWLHSWIQSNGVTQRALELAERLHPHVGGN